MATATVRVEGLRELNRAFARAPDTLKRDFRAAQRSIAEPVRRVAEHRAVAEIRGMPKSPAWGRMRTGITVRGVYVAPVKRGSRSAPLKRPNLAPMMMDRAMAPALALNAASTLRRFEDLLDSMATDWAR